MHFCQSQCARYLSVSGEPMTALPKHRTERSDPPLTPAGLASRRSSCFTAGSPRCRQQKAQCRWWTQAQAAPVSQRARRRRGILQRRTRGRRRAGMGEPTGRGRGLTTGRRRRMMRQGTCRRRLTGGGGCCKQRRRAAKVGGSDLAVSRQYLRLLADGGRAEW